VLSLLSYHCIWDVSIAIPTTVLTALALLRWCWADLQADSLDVSERQPAFLKDKGDALAAQGNYR
jgi:hypothetical protein